MADSAPITQSAAALPHRCDREQFKSRLSSAKTAYRGKVWFIGNVIVRDLSSELAICHRREPYVNFVLLVLRCSIAYFCKSRSLVIRKLVSSQKR